MTLLLAEECISLNAKHSKFKVLNQPPALVYIHMKNCILWLSAHKAAQKSCVIAYAAGYAASCAPVCAAHRSAGSKAAAKCGAVQSVSTRLLKPVAQASSSVIRVSAAFVICVALSKGPVEHTENPQRSRRGAWLTTHTGEGSCGGVHGTRIRSCWLRRQLRSKPIT